MKNLIAKPAVNLSNHPLYNLILISTVVLMYICVCTEADMYVPAFPEMIKYFGVAENQIQLVLTINFIGLCIASIFIGPLADSYGRRKILFVGLSIFMLSSIFIVFTDYFEFILLWRLIQGAAASVPMVCGGAIFMDKYSNEQASKLIGIINSFITASMAAAPVIGAMLVTLYGWKANFIVIMILSIITFIIFLLFIEESIPDKNKKSFTISSIIKDYYKILSNPRFNCYCLLACLPFITIIVYISSLSVIFINYLGIKLDAYSYYQASTMATFVFFSFLSVKIINKKGVTYTHNAGLIISSFGAFGLLITAIFSPNSPFLITINSGIIAAGGSLMAGTFGMKALSIFPEMNATALAACTVIRLFLISVLVSITEIFFDGTIMPIALVIFSYCFVGVIFYLLLHLKNFR